MPTPRKGARLGGSPAHQRHILANLATALFEHGRITTTETRARVLRPVAEKLITKARKGDLHNRREVLKTIRDKSVVHTLFTEIAPTFAERPGGYTRITKLGPRKGDNAPMAVIELVTEAYTPAAPKQPKHRATPAAEPAQLHRPPRSSSLPRTPPPRWRRPTRRARPRCSTPRPRTWRRPRPRVRLAEPETEAAPRARADRGREAARTTRRPERSLTRTSNRVCPPRRI